MLCVGDIILFLWGLVAWGGDGVTGGISFRVALLLKNFLGGRPGETKPFLEAVESVHFKGSSLAGGLVISGIS